MENLVFSINATFPVFILMLLGMLFRRLGFISDRFAKDMNSFVFKVALPVNVFSQLYTVDFGAFWDGRFIAFCFAGTAASIAVAALLSLLIRDRSDRGEFIQAAYRSSASLLGMAYIENMYPNAAMGSLMIIGAVPLYNAAAVVILSLTGSKSLENNVSAPAASSMNPAVAPADAAASVDHADAARAERAKLLKTTLVGIVTNPIILGIVFGVAWSALRIPAPKLLATTVSYIGRLSTPLGLLAMGASFSFTSAKQKLLPSLAATALKLCGFVALLVPAAIALGFRDQKLVAILIMAGSATTVSSFVMAKSMGHEGTLTATTVMLTSLFAAFSLTFFIWLLRTMGFI